MLYRELLSFIIFLFGISILGISSLKAYDAASDEPPLVPNVMDAGARSASGIASQKSSISPTSRTESISLEESGQIPPHRAGEVSLKSFSLPPASSPSSLGVHHSPVPQTSSNSFQEHELKKPQVPPLKLHKLPGISLSSSQHTLAPQFLSAPPPHTSYNFTKQEPKIVEAKASHKFLSIPPPPVCFPMIKEILLSYQQSEELSPRTLDGMQEEILDEEEQQILTQVQRQILSLLSMETLEKEDELEETPFTSFDLVVHPSHPDWEIFCSQQKAQPSQELETLKEAKAIYENYKKVHQSPAPDSPFDQIILAFHEATLVLFRILAIEQSPDELLYSIAQLRAKHSPVYIEACYKALRKLPPQRACEEAYKEYVEVKKYIEKAMKRISAKFAYYSKLIKCKKFLEKYYIQQRTKPSLLALQAKL